MVITEYNEEVFVKGIREEGYEDGYESGCNDGDKSGKDETILFAIKNLMKNLKCTFEQAMESLGIPRDERSKYMTLL